MKCGTDVGDDDNIAKYRDRDRLALCLTSVASFETKTRIRIGRAVSDPCYLSAFSLIQFRGKEHVVSKRDYGSSSKEDVEKERILKAGRQKTIMNVDERGRFTFLRYSIC